MKLKKLNLRNFAQFQDFEIEFDGAVTKLVGVNGSGKTTVGITGIWACLKGIAQKDKNGQLIGDRFRFIGGSSPTADIELTLVDEVKQAEIKIKNHISKQGNSISFKAPHGYPISASWVSDLLHVAFISPSHFARLDSKRQAIELGIDTKTFDKQIKELKEEYTIINRGLRNIGEIDPVAPCEKVDIRKLYAEKEFISGWNIQQLNNSREQISIKGHIKEIEAQINSLQASLKLKKEALAQIPNPMPLKVFDDSELTAAEITNQKADAYQRYLAAKAKAKADKEKIQTDAAANKAKQTAEYKKRVDYIRSFNLSFKGLDIDHEGGLLLNGRPISEGYFSRGELITIVAKLYTSLSPELKYIFLDDFELLDEDNQKSIIKYLLSQGFQIVTAEVGKESREQNTVLLRACRRVNRYEEENQKPNLL